MLVIHFHCISLYLFSPKTHSGFTSTPFVSSKKFSLCTLCLFVDTAKHFDLVTWQFAHETKLKTINNKMDIKNQQNKQHNYHFIKMPLTWNINKINKQENLICIYIIVTYFRLFFDLLFVHFNHSNYFKVKETNVTSLQTLVGSHLSCEIKALSFGTANFTLLLSFISITYMKAFKSFPFRECRQTENESYSVKSEKENVPASLIQTR